jgi:hypothetical protein
MTVQSEKRPYEPNMYSRRHVQRLHRGANKHNLVSLYGKRIVVDDAAPLASEIVLVSPEVLAIEQAALSTKPANWPKNAWNKKLACCGRIEKHCDCGSNRRYV